jgi:hypothetical protein
MNTTPEHLHAALNHVALFAAGFAILPFIHAIIKKSVPSLRLGLLFLVIGAAFTIPSVSTGESAEDRVEALVDQQGKQWLDLHEHRSKPLAIAFYVTGGLAVLASAVTLRSERFTQALAAGFAVVSLGLLLWVAYVADSGGKIRHPEFRNGAVVAPKSPDHDDD